MKPTNALVSKEKKEKKAFSAIITAEGAQKLIRASLRDEKAVRRFTGTLINIVKASEQLKNCEPGTVISCALRGEGMGLTYGHGYYVVPYGQSATFIPGFKGYIQLALATGLYADIDCIDVREGERKGRDKRTGKPIVDMSVYETDEEREQHPIIGYKSYFELKDGYYREEYWTVDELLRHADRYSRAFSLDTYRKWKNGEQLTAEERRAVENGPWYTNTERMMAKTALRSLLNSGYAPLSNELKSLFDKEPVAGDGVTSEVEDAITAEYTVDESTGEVTDESQEDSAEAPQSEEVVEEEKKNTAEPQKTHRRGRKPRIDAEAAEKNFFGE